MNEQGHHIDMLKISDSRSVARRFYFTNSVQQRKEILVKVITEYPVPISTNNRPIFFSECLLN